MFYIISEGRILRLQCWSYFCNLFPNFKHHTQLIKTCTELIIHFELNCSVYWLYLTNLARNVFLMFLKGMVLVTAICYFTLVPRMTYMGTIGHIKQSNQHKYLAYFPDSFDSELSPLNNANFFLIFEIDIPPNIKTI